MTRVVLLVLCGAALLLTPLLHAPAASAAQGSAPPPASTGHPSSNTPAQAEGLASRYADLDQSLEKTLSAESTNLDVLKEQLDRLRKLEKEVDTELSSYKFQISAHSNLILLPTASIDDLEKAVAAQNAAFTDISERLQELTQGLNNVDQIQKQLEDQLALNEAQLTELKTLKTGDPVVTSLLKRLQAVTKLLSEKRDTLGKLHDTYAARADKFNEVQAAFSGLINKFDLQIDERKVQGLFQRKTSPLVDFGWNQIREAFFSLLEQVRMVTSLKFWSEQLRMFWKSGGLLILTSLLLFGIAQALLFRFRRLCIHLGEFPAVARYPWRCFSLQLFQHSVPLLGTVVFIYAFAHLRSTYESIPLVRVGVRVLLVWLFTRWALDFMKLWSLGERPRIPEWLLYLLRILIGAVRFFAIAFVVLGWLAGSESVLLLMVRLLFEIALLAWSVLFFRAFRRESAGLFDGKSRLMSSLSPAFIAFGYIISSGGFLLELAGYGQLALYWYASWGKTAIVLLWGGLFFLMIREWDRSSADTPGLEAGGSDVKAHPVRWLLVRLSWLAWLGALVVCTMIAWGATQPMIFAFFRVLNYPIPIGGLDFRLLGIAYAIMILLFTHAATRLWRSLLQNRVLARSGIEPGLQESITTISIYLLWGVGILMALHALGIGTTSLTVAFGALGIGLGFGLQNIFNNFVSGLILLFERPIQVGDVVELNGVWGTVSRINVRSTVVQSFDNASLIIPNSEFVSNQLINWSFKDMRLRRSITVGVAYGSDTSLVQKTLLEIAEKHPRVFRSPKPDVLFTDFGDSALIFKLRIWTTLDHCMSAETEIRFEIDRLFRERGIEIPFPQRDIHIPAEAKKAILEAVSDE